MTRRPLIERRRTPPALALYTAVSIVVGFVVLGWATATLPIGSGIGNPKMPALVGGTDGTGLVFWIVLGFVGSLRTRAYHGRAVLTFHLPFLVAAMTLGGPVAAGWVGAISTLEMRELREVPWFGTLANHAGLALCGVVGGVVVMLLRTELARVADDQLATLAAALAGALVACAMNLAMNVTTIGLRERLSPAEAAATFDRSFRGTIGAEMILGWLLALTYGAIAWWAPIVCVALVLAVWQTNDEHELTSHDPMTGLLNRTGFNERLRVAVTRARGGRHTAALAMLDLDGFKAINDRLGHAAGDEVIQAVGARLREAVRFTDVAARLGGDEFALLLERVPDVATADAIARRIHLRLCEPLRLEAGDVRVGASLGLVFLDRASDAVETLDVADRAMYEVKGRGGGVVVAGSAP
jgi:diguanylate cyclase (GGDEF)-like protein